MGTKKISIEAETEARIKAEMHADKITDKKRLKQLLSGKTKEIIAEKFGSHTK
jgi:hypothetical protein